MCADRGVSIHPGAGAAIALADVRPIFAHRGGGRKAKRSVHGSDGASDHAGGRRQSGPCSNSGIIGGIIGVSSRATFSLAPSGAREETR